MVLALFLLAALQDSEYIQKLDKLKYNLATKSCKEAEKKLDSDERAAIDRLTRIIDDPELPKKECNLYVQQTDQYDPPYAFFPYQYRARARLSLAAKAGSDSEKRGYLEEAIRDLQESLRRNVKSSGSYLESAQKELQRQAAGSPTPAPQDLPVPLGVLRVRQSQLLSENRFKSARALVDQDGKGLSAQDRADLLAQVDRACRNYLTEELRLFRARLQRIPSVAELRAMTKDEFDVTFDLPAPAEIVVAHPAFDWARRQKELYRDVWSGAKPGSALLAAAEDAAHVEEGAENPWLRISEALGFQDLHDETERRIAEGVDAPRDRRAVLAAEIQGRMLTWNAFVEHLAPEVRKRAAWIDEHTRSLRALADRQPREPAELDREDLRGCFETFPVEAELLQVEGKLRKLESGGGLARESRQKLYSLLVAARALRLFLEGKPEEEVFRAVREDLERLSRVGGPSNLDRFGPRIRKVYDSLR